MYVYNIYIVKYNSNLHCSPLYSIITVVVIVVVITSAGSQNSHYLVCLPSSSEQRRICDFRRQWGSTSLEIVISAIVLIMQPNLVAVAYLEHEGCASYN